MSCKWGHLDNAQLLRSINKVRAIHIVSTVLFKTKGATVPSYVYTSLGISHKYPGLLDKGFVGVAGTYNATDLEYKLRRWRGVTPHIEPCPLLRKARDDKEYVTLIPVYICFGLQTGWLVCNARGESELMCMKSLPEPTEIYFHVPATFEECYYAGDVFDAASLAGSYTDSPEDTPVITLRLKDYDLQSNQGLPLDSFDIKLDIPYNTSKYLF